MTHAEAHCRIEITVRRVRSPMRSTARIGAMARGLADRPECDVPLQFTAFHPDDKMTDVNFAPPATLRRGPSHRPAQWPARRGHRRWRESAGGTTSCPGCERPLIVRDRRVILRGEFDECGHGLHCGRAIAGRSSNPVRALGRRRVPLRVAP
jgi:pyruvate formate lyase activating enzyme